MLATIDLETDCQNYLTLLQTVQYNVGMVGKVAQTIANIVDYYYLDGAFSPSKFVNSSASELNRAARLYVMNGFDFSIKCADAAGNVINANQLYMKPVNYEAVPSLDVSTPDSLMLNDDYFTQFNAAWSAIEERINAVVQSLLDCNLIKEKQPTITYQPSDINKGLLETAIAKVQANQTAGTFSFGYITDVHYCSNDPLGGGSMAMGVTKLGLDHLNNIAYLSQFADLSFIEHNGDLYDGYNSEPNAEQDIKTAANTLASNSKCPVYFTKGNHDDNGPYAHLNATAASLSGSVYLDDLVVPTSMSIDMFGYNAVGAHYDSQETDKTYYYFDVSGQKVRAFVLNTFDGDYTGSGNELANGYLSYDHSVIRQQQMEWFYNQLTLVPDDWYVLVFAHNPIAPVLNGWSMANGTQYMAILEAFQNATATTVKPETLKGRESLITTDFSADFTGKPQKRLIAVFNGHMHRDANSTVNNVLHVETTCSMAKNDGQFASGRGAGTVYEDAWDGVTVDLNNRTLKLARFGAGNDRTFNF